MPDVLLDLMWPTKEKMNSYLEVDFEFVNKSNEEIRRNHFSRAPWEKEVTMQSISTNTKSIKSAVDPEANMGLDAIKRIRRWEKYSQLGNELPNRILHKFESEDQGAFKLKFSHKGKYLAACCTLGNGKTIVKIFDVEDEMDQLKVVLQGHNDLIHDIDWSLDDKYLVTGSADGCCKVWNLEKINITSQDKLNYADNNKLFFLCELQHPSFVYGCKFYSRMRAGSEGPLLLARHHYLLRWQG